MTGEEMMQSLDHFLGMDMAYFSTLAGDPKATVTLPGNELESQMAQYTDEQNHLNPAYLAWRAIANASEHAGFAEHMRYVTSGGVVPRPHASLARVSLLGAARAVFILSPDDSRERAVRAARLANAEAQDARRMIDNWSSQAGPEDLLGGLEHQAQDLAQEAARILIAADQNGGSKIDETSLLREAVAALSVSPPDGEEQILTLWNRISGVAHARSCQGVVTACTATGPNRQRSGTRGGGPRGTQVPCQSPQSGPGGASDPCGHFLPDKAPDKP
jgi:hypothetical protein